MLLLLLRVALLIVDGLLGIVLKLRMLLLLYLQLKLLLLLLLLLLLKLKLLLLQGFLGCKHLWVSGLGLLQLRRRWELLLRVVIVVVGRLYLVGVRLADGVDGRHGQSGVVLEAGRVVIVAVLFSLADSLQRRCLVDGRVGCVPVAVWLGRESRLDVGRVAVTDALGWPAGEPYGVVVVLSCCGGVAVVVVVVAAGEDALDDLACRSLLGGRALRGLRG